ncbi:MAG: hypothetical protein QNJ53_23785 [Pleurocapsa sp. MO_192.B19]|nr:hypothetical protein [Pleurocapsa sp. MO_192.B19]
MVITANQTRQPPQAPSTPVVAQQALSELIQYYRELADYHRSAVDYHRQLLEQHSQDTEVAEKQLASIETILHPLTTESANQDISSNYNGRQLNGTAKISPAEDKSIEPEPKKQGREATTELEKSEAKVSKSVTQAAPKKNSKNRSSSTARTAKTRKPAKRKNTNKTKKSTKAFSSRLPYSEKLASCQTIVDAVALCLQEYYPKVINAEDIVNYYYPEGLEGETRKKAYEAFSNSLSKGAGKQGWVRSSIGKYRWKEES